MNRIYIAAFAFQSWLFAKLVQVFQFTGSKLIEAANFWSLMFFVLALAMGAFYFDLGYASTSMSVVGDSYIPNRTGSSEKS